MKTLRRYILLFAGTAACSVLGITSCHKDAPKENPEDIVIAVGDSVLTVDRVVQKIPQGLSVEDSLAMYNAIVEDWLRERLLCDIAIGSLPHPEQIEQQVRDYRNRLIAMEYRRLMGNNPESKVNEDTVRSFYDAHKPEMVLQAPIIQGLYIKVPSNDSEIEDIRRWIERANPQSIDKLEKHGLKNALQFDHFTDRWVAWQAVAEQIPYRFGDADTFLSKGKIFETEHNGNTYLLHVTDVMHTGQEMPYEYASIQIRDMMADNDRLAYDKKLYQGLYDKGVKDKRIIDNRNKQ